MEGGVTLDFRILGPFEVCGEDGVALALGGRKRRGLLALLLLNRNELVTSERLLEEVWGGSQAQSAGPSLQVYVSQLRKLLGGAQVLQTRQGGYSLAVTEDELDAARFERLLGDARRLLAGGQPEPAAQELRKALALWRGPPLADLGYESFAQAEIARLEELRLVALELRIEAELALGHHAELLPELEALAAEQPLRERLRGHLMLALYRSGRQADALAAYQDARRTLGDELGLEPSPELKQLEAAILRQDPALTVEPAELKARRRLPSPATALVGRRREVDDLTELVRGEARLVTLTGPGGTGKTRVAIQAAHELADAFPHGVVFVGLAGLRDPELVPAQIVSALGVEDGTRPVAESLAEHLRERTALLLVDNFEQVDAAAPALGSLLVAAPRLRLLVTSRHPLRIYGEHEFPVPPLVEAEAVDLFVARARAVERGFEASADVSELCLLLDRLPLAIELVAARVRELPPRELVTNLPRRLELAVGGPRDAPARHQTLWATIDWSFELLDESSQALFARLAVFDGGCTLEAAADVCEADPELIRSLVDTSLVVGTGERVALLETIREYALERLDGLGESNTIRRRHANYYLSLVLAGKEVRRDPREVEWMDRLEADRENVRAAFAFLLEHEPEEAARLADGAYRFWYLRAHFEEGLRAFERVLRFGDLLTPGDRANALMYSAGFAFGHRELVRARALAEEALELQRRLGELDSIAKALVLIGTIRNEEGDHEAAVEALEESVELARRHGDALVLSFALGHLVMATVNAEMYGRTRELGEEALALMRSLSNADSEATVLSGLGTAALRQGDCVEAAERFSAALATATDRGDPVSMLDHIEAIAAVAVAVGEPASAARLLGGAEAIEAAREIQLEAASVRMREETVAALQEALGEADLDAHWHAGQELTLESAAEEAAELADRLRSRA